MRNRSHNDVIQPASHSDSSPRDTPATALTRVPTITIKDVARESGVSIGTVSNVLNGRVTLVRTQTRERVLQAARTLNFQPSAAARSLVQGRTRTLGVLFHTGASAIVADPYASTILQGILNGASGAGYGLLLYPEPWRDQEQGTRLFAHRRADGILVIAPRVEVIPDIMALGLPLALVSVRYRPADFAAASSPNQSETAIAADVDNMAGGRIAAEYLLSLGHRKIAHLGGDPFQGSAQEREEGWRTALARARVDCPPEYFVLCDYQGDTGYAATRLLLSLPHPPTAIFAANDKLAFACLQAARDAGVRVPDQLSVIGFDDIPSAAVVTPPLTTIRQPLVQIGRAAAEVLIARLESRARAPSSESSLPVTGSDCLLFPPELVVRGSTAPPLPPLCPDSDNAA